MTLLQTIGQFASLDQRIHDYPDRTNGNCQNLMDWRSATEDKINHYLPHGSGFDAQATLVSYNDQRVVIDAPYHHTNDNGYYDGWVTYRLTIRSTFNGPDIQVKVKGYDNTARKYADDHMRDYVAEVYHEALTRDID